MDLEQINEQYTKLRDKIKKLNEAVEVNKKQLVVLDADKGVQEALAKQAEVKGDKDSQEKAEDQVRKINSSIKSIKDILEEREKEIKKAEEWINSQIEAIKQNPEMKKHLEEVMAKRYNRTIEKKEKEIEQKKLAIIQKKNEKEEIKGKIDRLTNLQKLVVDHPSLANNLKGILAAKKEINDLKSELESITVKDEKTGKITYTDPQKARKIKKKLLPEIEKRLSKNRNLIVGYITKNSLDITEQDINELSESTLVLNSNGEIDIEGTVKSRETTMNNQIEIIDESIEVVRKDLIETSKSAKKYQKALINLENRPKVENQEKESGEEKKEEKEPQKKWRQKLFGFFKKWFKKDEPKGLPEPPVEEKEEAKKEDKPEPKENPFKDSLKYQIIQDIAKQVESDEIKESEVVKKPDNEGR